MQTLIPTSSAAIDQDKQPNPPSKLKATQFRAIVGLVIGLDIAKIIMIYLHQQQFSARDVFAALVATTFFGGIGASIGFAAISLISTLFDRLKASRSSR